MAETMIERVARAMEPILFGGLPDGECGPATARRRAETRAKARAAITAMREPAAFMYGAGGVEQFKADMAGTPVREAVGRVYVSMIDAALKETN
ncbi:MAG: hypothetical protein Unbinned3696contig1008_47 [Prokaryotic dsDNA virus sp.]|nr:MAG: hypothetical protein Unbinned3696contig1008_47 [Prokaryotic dsDNA virus sp.]|tara:strand:+ start:285 stop:566 length:282 start_codon:yes stop_codon:yes gene_type:complete